MTSHTTIPVFDGHNDVLLRLSKLDAGNPELAFIEGGHGGHLDLPRAKAGGFAGGLFAVYVPTPKDSVGSTDGPAAGTGFLSLTDAQKTAFGMISTLVRIERSAGGQFKICRSIADIHNAMATGSIAAVMHIEGAEMIDPDLEGLDVLHQAGLRSLGPLWSRDNVFGYGVPFSFQSSPDIGPGLTERGEALVRACNELKIMVDLSHLTEKGFWDVERISTAPLVASHSNAHAICPHSRNLTDRQLDAIRERDGLVGLNFGVIFIRADGKKDVGTPLDDLIRHIDYLVERVGLDRVGFGSDYDGAAVPTALGGVDRLQSLVEAMRAKGYDDDALKKICHENWLRVLGKTWG